MTMPLDRDMRRREFLVKKQAIPCKIMTVAGLVEGDLHKRAAFRVIDELNQGESYIAVTNATLGSDVSGNGFKSDFLIIRTDQIVWVSPAEEETVSAG